MTSPQFDFHAKEYEKLRDEIRFYSREVRFMERAAVIGPVTAFSWLSAQAERPDNAVLLLMAWWLPLILVIFVWSRRRHADKSVMRIAGYLRHVESQFADPALRGWENYLQAIRDNPGAAWRPFGRSFWLGVFAVCIVVPAVATASKLDAAIAALSLIGRKVC